MAKFQPGQSGNKRGRPTKEEMALRGLTETELSGVLRKLKRASGDAVGLMIAAMHNPDFSETTRLKYAKDVYDLYLKTIGVDSNLKKVQTDKPETVKPDEDDEINVPQVVFKIAG